MAVVRSDPGRRPCLGRDDGIHDHHRAGLPDHRRTPSCARTRSSPARPPPPYPTMPGRARSTPITIDSDPNEGTEHLSRRAPGRPAIPRKLSARPVALMHDAPVTHANRSTPLCTELDRAGALAGKGLTSQAILALLQWCHGLTKEGSLAPVVFGAAADKLRLRILEANVVSLLPRTQVRARSGNPASIRG